MGHRDKGGPSYHRCHHGATRTRRASHESPREDRLWTAGARCLQDTHRGTATPLRPARRRKGDPKSLSGRARVVTLRFFVFVLFFLLFFYKKKKGEKKDTDCIAGSQRPRDPRHRKLFLGPRRLSSGDLPRMRGWGTARCRSARCPVPVSARGGRRGKSLFGGASEDWRHLFRKRMLRQRLQVCQESPPSEQLGTSVSGTETSGLGPGAVPRGHAVICKSDAGRWPD